MSDKEPKEVARDLLYGTAILQLNTVMWNVRKTDGDNVFPVYLSRDRNLEISLWPIQKYERTLTYWGPVVRVRLLVKVGDTTFVTWRKWDGTVDNAKRIIKDIASHSWEKRLL